MDMRYTGMRFGMQVSAYVPLSSILIAAAVSSFLYWNI